MNFFDMSKENTITSNSTVWIFFAASALLSVVTLLLYRRQLKRRDTEAEPKRHWRRMLDRVLVKNDASEKKGLPNGLV